MTTATAYSGKAAIAREVGAPWTVEDVQFAEPQAGEVLVKIVATGMCHTDLVCKDGFPVPMPIVLGHEGAGVVEAVGDGVTRVKPGDHVVLSFSSCGACKNCGKGDPAYCFSFVERNFGGNRPNQDSRVSQNGEIVYDNFFGQSSFGQYAVSNEANTVVVDKDLPLEKLGPLGCGLQTGAGAVANSLNAQAGDSLIIFGGGAVGLAALMAAVALGVTPVTVVEPKEERRKLALELGATHAVDPIAAGDGLQELLAEKMGGGADLVVDTTGIPDMMAVGALLLLPNGHLGLIGVPPQDATLPINMMDMLLRGSRITSITEGDARPQEFIPQMLDWYKAGKFPFDKLIKEFPFEQINEAAAASLDGSAIKPVLLF